MKIFKHHDNSSRSNCPTIWRNHTPHFLKEMHISSFKCNGGAWVMLALPSSSTTSRHCYIMSLHWLMYCMYYRSQQKGYWAGDCTVSLIRKLLPIAEYFSWNECMRPSTGLWIYNKSGLTTLLTAQWEHDSCLLSACVMSANTVVFYPQWDSCCPVNPC